MGKILYIGSNFSNHDSSIFAIWENSLFGMSEERFTRFKHDFIWPIKALEALKKELLINPDRIEKIVFSISLKSQENLLFNDIYDFEKKYRKLIKGKYLKEYHANRKTFLNQSKILQFAKILTQQPYLAYNILKNRFRIDFKPLSFYVEKYLKQVFGNIPIEIFFYDHHDCHAISASIMSGFEKSLLITMDGWGDDAFTKIYQTNGNNINILSESHSTPIEHKYLPYDIPLHILETGVFKHTSVGNIYSIMTYLAEFMPTADEGKLEALSAYGIINKGLSSKLKNLCHIENEIIKIDKDKYLALLFNDKSLSEIKKIPKENLACTTQKFLEEIYLSLIKNVLKKYPFENICLSGGVSANVILNMKIYIELNKNIFISPPMTDEGTAMGAAFKSLLEANQNYDFSWIKNYQMPYFGTSHSATETLDFLKNHPSLPINYEYLGDKWPSICAKLVCNNKIGAIFQGRAEFGPRALGNRSIVADFRKKENIDVLNKLVKNRPGFQPFCPSFLDEEKDILFEKAYLNKHMTCAFLMKKEYKKILPCAVHIDGTSRVQFVSEKDNPAYYKFLKEIKKITGFGGVINTSFNKHGRTICEKPKDALTDFIDCGIDFLIINGYLVKRK